MLKVFYYYYYLFYSKIVVQPEPHFVTVLALSAIEGLFINYLIDFLVVYLFHTIPSEVWYKLLLVVVLLIINFNYYERKGKGMTIVKEKPRYFNNHRLTIAIVFITSIFIISLLFWAVDYQRIILAKFEREV